MMTKHERYRMVSTIPMFAAILQQWEPAFDDTPPDEREGPSEHEMAIMAEDYGKEKRDGKI
jgi:hypothetical protein